MTRPITIFDIRDILFSAYHKWQYCLSIMQTFYVLLKTSGMNLWILFKKIIKFNDGLFYQYYCLVVDFSICWSICHSHSFSTKKTDDNWDPKRAYREDWTINANPLRIPYATKSSISAINSLTKLLKTLWYNPIYTCF